MKKYFGNFTEKEIVMGKILNEGKTYTKNQLMEGFTEDYFETSDGVKLRYLHKGEGMPFILLHGYSDDADCWLLNAPEYAKEFSVYCFDQRGHGYSYAEHGARISRLAADLHEFIEAIGEPKVNLLGWSMGCSVIWSYMDLFGYEKINKAIFDDEPVMLVANPRFTQEEIMLTGSNPMDVWYLVNTVEEYGCAWTGDDSPFFKAFPACFRRGAAAFTEEELAKVPDNYPELYAKRPSQSDVVPKKFMAALLKDHLMLDWRDLMPKIKVPVMFMTGDISHATTRELGEWMVNTIPDCRWERFSAEEYGIHDINQLAYKRFNQVVMDFLAD